MYSKKDMLPVRYGPHYCAPFCGRNCTYAAFAKATRDAAKLAKRLGPGWKPDVWENLGWHWSVVSDDGLLKIYPSHGGGYHGLLGEKGHGGRWAANGPTVPAVVAALLADARPELRLVQRLVKSAERLSGDGS